MIRNSAAVDGMYDVEECTFNNATPLSLSCFIVERRYVLILRKALKDRSASHDVTGNTITHFSIFLTLGKISGLAC